MAGSIGGVSLERNKQPFLGLPNPLTRHGIKAVPQLTKLKKRWACLEFSVGDQPVLDVVRSSGL